MHLWAPEGDGWSTDGLTPTSTFTRRLSPSQVIPNKASVQGGAVSWHENRLLDHTDTSRCAARKTGITGLQLLRINPGWVWFCRRVQPCTWELPVRWKLPSPALLSKIMSIFLALRQSFTFSGLCVLGDTLALGPGQCPVILGCGYSSVQSVLIQEERCCRGAEAVLHLWNCTWALGLAWGHRSLRRSKPAGWGGEPGLTQSHPYWDTPGYSYSPNVLGP